jgi:hypothetical protein
MLLQTLACMLHIASLLGSSVFLSCAVNSAAAAITPPRVFWCMSWGML